MLKKGLSVWILMVLLMVTLPSVAVHYSAGSRPFGGIPVNVPTSLSGTEMATNFSIIALPDTQFYSASYPDIFYDQTRWIADNAQSMNIMFVTHEGDIVNDYGSLSEWNNANNSMSRLDVGNVSYGVLPGNHDGSPGNVANYNVYFNYSRFSGRSWYGGAYQNDNSNNFELFRGGQDDYLIFHLQYQPSDQVLAWANSTLQDFPDRRVIVTTHSYLNVDGTRTDIGQRIWDSLIAPHADRIFLVLCGHNHAEAERADAVNGHTVYQLLADYQDRINGGNGWLRILQFCPGGSKICVRTYSPYLGSYENDSDSQFTLNYDMTGAKVIVVPDDYSTIQEAINAANDGDAVFVRSGTYYEHVIVNKTISLVGENAGSTIIDGSDTGSVVALSANNVTLSGFTVQHSGTWADACVGLDHVTGCCVLSNVFKNSSLSGWQNLGISAVGSSQNLLSGNCFSSGRSGIVLAGSSNDNWVVNNTINLPEGAIVGIQIGDSGGNHIVNSTISNTIGGIWISGTQNAAVGNTIFNNTCGVEIYAGSSNIFYHNNFINNALQVHLYSTSDNSWDDNYPSGGNYWSDYNGTDLYLGPAQDQIDGDGIGDTPYLIDANNIDHYPLMSPWTPPNAAALNISSSKTIVGQGFSTSVTVHLENQGSKIEELYATFYANYTFIGYQTFMLRSNNSIIYSGDWDLASLAKGNYSLSVRIAPLEGETDLNDNSMNGSWVFITIPGDLNGDKTVDIYDAIILANHFAFPRFRISWDSNVDINNDEMIDIYDAIILAANYGKSWT